MRDLIHSFFIGTAAASLVVGLANVPRVAAESHAPPAAPAEASKSEGSTTGTVVETMNAGPYTYVHVDDGAKKMWAAAPQFPVAVGDKVIVPAGDPMHDFHSKTLDRTFDLIYFVGGIQVVGGQPAKLPKAAAAHGDGSAPEHGAMPHGAAPATTVDLSNIQKAAGGQTVAELFAQKASLVGKEVAVRGRVVKYTPEVMGKNWLHVRDGSGGTGTNDLTVSTSATAEVGNTVVVRGKLVADRDLGAGYRYDVIIEDATVSVE